MLKFTQKSIGMCLLISLSFLLFGCQRSSPEQRLISQFSAQETVSCTIQSRLVFSSISADADESQHTFDMSATADTQLNSQFFHMEGTLNQTQGSLDLGPTEVESFYDPEYKESYSRFGTHYSLTGADTGLGTLVRMPLSLHLDQNYALQEESELVYGSVCDVYVGSELSAGPDIPVYIQGNHASFSLADIPMQVRLATDPNTFLPVKLTLTYLPDGSDKGSFALPNGTKYTLQELSFEVIYQHYGQPIDTSVPDAFRQLARSPAQPAPAEPDTPPEPKDAYLIETPNQSCRYQISAPEYMAPETVTDSSASFYYFYSEEDFEIIEYNLWEDFSPQDAAAYTDALPQLLRETGTYGDLSSSKVNTMLLDDRQIQYRVIRFQTAENDLLYDGMLVYSWCSAPNGSDVLEVVLWEYNATGDRSFIRPEEELCFAYRYAEPAAGSESK